MVLSEDGDHPMTRLSDTQLVILGGAAQRADLSVLPLPETLKLKGGALNKVMDSLRNRGLIRVIETDGRPQRVVITSEGMAAIGVEREDEGQTTAPTEADTAPTPAEAGVQASTPRRQPARPTGRPSRPRVRPRRGRPSRARPRRPRSPRHAPVPSRPR